MKIIEQAEVKIEKCFGYENNLYDRKRDHWFYRNKLSMLALNKGNLFVQAEKNKFLKIDVKYLINILKCNLCDQLPSELNVPKFKYKIVTDNRIYIFFETNCTKSLKNLADESRNGLEERVLVDIML